MNFQIGKVSPPSQESTAATAVSPFRSSAAATEIAARPQAATPAPQHPIAAPTMSLEATKQIARQINEFLKSSDSNVQFAIDSESSKVVVRVVDSQTREVIRQIPSEELLAISRSLDQLTGLLIHQKA